MLAEELKSSGIGEPGRSETKQIRKQTRRKSNPADILSAFTFLVDTCVILSGLIAGFWVKFHSGWIPFGVEEANKGIYDYSGLIGIGSLLLIASFAYTGVYESNLVLKFESIAARITKATIFWFIAYLSVSLVLKFSPPISRIYVLSSFLFTLGGLLVWRWSFVKIVKSTAIARNLRQNIAIFGWNEDSLQLYKAIKADKGQAYNLRAIFSTNPSALSDLKGSHCVVFPNRMTDEEIVAELKKHQIQIVVNTDVKDPARVSHLAGICERNFINFKIVPSYFQILINGLALENMSGVPLMGINKLPLDRAFNKFLKRIVDIIGACVGLLISAPLIAIFGALIWKESPGSIFFKQERVGKNGKRFNMIKLRSMKLGSDKRDHLSQSTLREDDRVLKVGKFIRKWNIDETPQFWNVLIGDMSLVGPRPERTFHSEKLSDEIPHYNARYNSKPGITGLAQVNGLRGDTDLTERVKFDLFYLEHWTIWLDFQIMLRTFWKNENAY